MEICTMSNQNVILESHSAVIPRLILWCLILFQSSAHACDGWRVLPIRSQQEFELGRIGGEATQHLHGIARSPSHPDIIYWSQDVGQVWKSTDAGQTWLKTIGKGLYLRYGQSIEVDPINPKIVFVIVDNVWNRMAKDYEGVYRSTNGGDGWEFVLPTPVNFVHNANPITHRMYKHNITYDPASVEASGAKTWYAAFVKNGLYRSEDYGRHWTRVADLRDHDTLYGIQAHPSDGKTVYIASGDGLFAFSPENGLHPLGHMPCGAVFVHRNPPGRSDHLCHADVQKVESIRRLPERGYRLSQGSIL